MWASASRRLGFGLSIGAIVPGFVGRTLDRDKPALVASETEPCADGAIADAASFRLAEELDVIPASI